MDPSAEYTATNLESNVVAVLLVLKELASVAYRENGDPLMSNNERCRFKLKAKYIEELSESRLSNLIRSHEYPQPLSVAYQLRLHEGLSGNTAWHLH